MLVWDWVGNGIRAAMVLVSENSIGAYAGIWYCDIGCFLKELITGSKFQFFEGHLHKIEISNK